MPHINIKHFPLSLSDEQKTKLSDAITKLIQDHLKTKKEHVSIALEQIDASKWQTTVYVPEIMGRSNLLIKKPGY